MELTKQDIMQYLRTVGLLEWNIHDIDNDIKRLDAERQQLFVKRSFEKQQYYPLSYCIKRFVISLLISVVIGVVALILWNRLTTSVILSLFPSLEGMSADDNASLVGLLNCLWYIPPALLTIFLVYRSKGSKMLLGYIKSKKDNVVNSYDFSKQEKQRLEDVPNQVADLEYQQNCLINLTNKMNYELEQAYELNIIHRKYRNLQAVYTLYEYFEAGSVDTLKEAINKYDSESRLDNISAQLGEIRQGINRIYDEMFYQSQLMQESNELARQQLESTRVIADTTRQIARNTQITAFNTSALLLIEERKAYYRDYDIDDIIRDY